MPLLLTRTVWLPIVIPYSALKLFVTTLYSRIPSTPNVLPVPDAALTHMCLPKMRHPAYKLFD